MASITDIVLAGKGTAGKWKVNRDWHGRNVLFHYSTAMLAWNPDDPTDESVLDYSTGWGSVSDQGGMNRAFKALGIPRYFSRAGGAQIVETDPDNAIALRDSYLEMREKYAWVR